MKALRKLSSPSTSVSVREEMIERAEAGEKIGEEEVKSARSAVLEVEEANPHHGADLGVKGEQPETPVSEPEVIPPRRLEPIFALDEPEIPLKDVTPTGVNDTPVESVTVPEISVTPPQEVQEPEKPKIISPDDLNISLRVELNQYKDATESLRNKQNQLADARAFSV
jgi:hypothetical protein